MTTKHLAARATPGNGNGSLHSSTPEQTAALSQNVSHQSRVNRVTIQKQSFSISEFCKLNDISRSLFYLLRVKGKAPRVMKVGRRTLISVEAAAEWRKDMEQMTNP